jgi:hypothetical protein
MKVPAGLLKRAGCVVTDLTSDPQPQRPYGVYPASGSPDGSVFCQARFPGKPGTRYEIQAILAPERSFLESLLEQVIRASIPWSELEVSDNSVTVVRG